MVRPWVLAAGVGRVGPPRALVDPGLGPPLIQNNIFLDWSGVTFIYEFPSHKIPNPTLSTAITIILLFLVFVLQRQLVRLLYLIEGALSDHCFGQFLEHLCDVAIFLC